METEVKEESGAKITLDSKEVHYEGDIAIYTDPSSGQQFQWDKENNIWNSRTNVIFDTEKNVHTYTDADGVQFFWDVNKNAWFPMIDDDFMARYQLSYGVNVETDAGTKPVEVIPKKQPSKKTEVSEPRKAAEPTWFELDESQNTKVYVSNLPADVSEEEFVDLMQKCGLVMRDPTTLKFKIKLYKESDGETLKGDALCTYIKIESVDLAITLLDGYEFKGKKIRVERAKFQMKGKFNPKLKPKMKKRKEKLKLKKIQEKLFDWRPEKVETGELPKHKRIVIVKNLFDPKIFDTDVGLILEFQEDLREECSKLGEVRKVTIYDCHPEGVAQINMATPEQADKVLQLMNGRWFMKRQLTAEIWDGKTKYKIIETDSQITQRLNKWDKFLEDSEEQQPT